jgi:hypothetical protein
MAPQPSVAAGPRRSYLRRFPSHVVGGALLLAIVIGALVSFFLVRYAPNPCGMTWSRPVFTRVAITQAGDLARGARAASLANGGAGDGAGEPMAGTRFASPGAGTTTTAGGLGGDSASASAATSRLAYKYSLFRYANGFGTRPLDPSSHPVLFVPGHQGSHKQVRSLAAAALARAQQLQGGERPGNGAVPGADGVDASAAARASSESAAAAASSSSSSSAGGGAAPITSSSSSVEFFTLDFREESTALLGHALADQAEYINDAVAAIRALYARAHLASSSSSSSSSWAPPAVTIVGHSMGGVAARLAPLLPNARPGAVGTIVTLATPHTAPPVQMDGVLSAAYDRVAREWGEAARAAGAAQERQKRRAEAKAARRAAAARGEADGGFAEEVEGEADAGRPSPLPLLASAHPLADVVLLSISSGESDWQMWEPTTALVLPEGMAGTRGRVAAALPPGANLTMVGEEGAMSHLLPVPWGWVSTLNLPALHFPVDHLAVMWCGQLVEVLSRALVDEARLCYPPSGGGAGAGAGGKGAASSASTTTAASAAAPVSGPARAIPRAAVSTSGGRTFPATIAPTSLARVGAGNCTPHERLSLLLTRLYDSLADGGMEGGGAGGGAHWGPSTPAPPAGPLLALLLQSVGVDPSLHTLSVPGLLAVAPVRFAPLLSGTWMMCALAAAAWLAAAVAGLGQARPSRGGGRHGADEKGEGGRQGADAFPLSRVTWLDASRIGAYARTLALPWWDAPLALEDWRRKPSSARRAATGGVDYADAEEEEGEGGDEGSAHPEAPSAPSSRRPAVLGVIALLSALPIAFPSAVRGLLLGASPHTDTYAPLLPTLVLGVGLSQGLFPFAYVLTWAVGTIVRSVVALVLALTVWPVRRAAQAAGVSVVVAGAGIAAPLLGSLLATQGGQALLAGLAEQLLGLGRLTYLLAIAARVELAESLLWEGGLLFPLARALPGLRAAALTLHGDELPPAEAAAVRAAPVQLAAGVSLLLLLADVALLCSAATRWTVADGPRSTGGAGSGAGAGGGEGVPLAAAAAAAAPAPTPSSAESATSRMRRERSLTDVGRALQGGGGGGPPSVDNGVGANGGAPLLPPMPDTPRGRAHSLATGTAAAAAAAAAAMPTSSVVREAIPPWAVGGGGLVGPLSPFASRFSRHLRPLAARPDPSAILAVGVFVPMFFTWIGPALHMAEVVAFPERSSVLPLPHPYPLPGEGQGAPHPPPHPFSAQGAVAAAAEAGRADDLAAAFAASARALAFALFVAVARALIGDGQILRAGVGGVTTGGQRRSPLVAFLLAAVSRAVAPGLRGSVDAARLDGELELEDWSEGEEPAAAATQKPGEGTGEGTPSPSSHESAAPRPSAKPARPAHPACPTPACIHESGGAKAVYEECDESLWRPAPLSPGPPLPSWTVVGGGPQPPPVAAAKATKTNSGGGKAGKGKGKGQQLLPPPAIRIPSPSSSSFSSPSTPSSSPSSSGGCYAWTGPTFRVVECACWASVPAALRAAARTDPVLAALGWANAGVSRGAPPPSSPLPPSSIPVTHDDRLRLRRTPPEVVRALLCDFCACTCVTCGGGGGGLARELLRVKARARPAGDGDGEDGGRAGAASQGWFARLCARIHGLLVSPLTVFAGLATALLSAPVVGGKGGEWGVRVSPASRPVGAALFVLGAAAGVAGAVFGGGLMDLSTTAAWPATAAAVGALLGLRWQRVRAAAPGAGTGKRVGE